MKISLLQLIALSIVLFSLGMISKDLVKSFKNRNDIIPEDNSIHFIWNDDEESIPPDGSLILIEFTDENDVYIGPKDQ